MYPTESPRLLPPPPPRAGKTLHTRKLSNKIEENLPWPVFHEEQNREIVQPGRQLWRIRPQGPLPNLHALSIAGLRLAITAMLHQKHCQHVRFRRDCRMSWPEHAQRHRKRTPEVGKHGSTYGVGRGRVPPSEPGGGMEGREGEGRRVHKLEEGETTVEKRG